MLPKIGSRFSSIIDGKRENGTIIGHGNAISKQKGTVLVRYDRQILGVDSTTRQAMHPISEMEIL